MSRHFANENTETKSKWKRTEMKKYLYIIKTQIIKSMTYEFNVYGNIIMQTIIMITSAYFWRALYTGRSAVNGVDVGSMSKEGSDAALKRDPLQPI